jgi:hypothetical protein
MNCSHNPAFRVHQKHGQAIGGSHRQQDARLNGQQRITFRLGKAGMFGQGVAAQAVLEFAAGCALNVIDSGGMDLPKRRQGEVLHAKLLKEKFSIFPYPGALFALRESQVQPRRRSAAHSTAASTECMGQPGITGDEWVLDPSQPATGDDL